MPELDRIDQRLLEEIGGLPGCPVALIVARLDFDSNFRSHRALRRRVHRLKDFGFVSFDKKSQRGRLLCYLTEEGKKTAGHAGTQTVGGIQIP